MKLKYIEIDKIKVCPNQPRRYFDPIKMEELADSIRHYGIIEPVCVRRVRGKYELIAGERRIRAARMVGMNKVPAIVRFVKNDAVLPMTILENIGRQDLSIFDEAEVFQKIIERSIITRAQLAERIGISEESILAKIQALRLPEEARKIINKYNMSEWHAEEVLRINEKEKQILLLKVAGENGLSPSKTRELVLCMKNEDANIPEAPTRKQVVKNDKIYINTIKNTISMMNKAGVGARTSEKEDENYIRFTVEIKK